MTVERAQICKRDGELIAATVYLRHRDTLFYKFNASDPTGLDARPNDLLLWSGIELAARLGVDLRVVFDGADSFVPASEVRGGRIATAKDAHQAFGANHAAIGQRHLRLVVHPHAAIAQALAQFIGTQGRIVEGHGDLRPEDILLAFRGGKLAGTLAGWDQRGFRQSVVHAYSPGMRWARPFYNCWARLRGLPSLPPPGQT